MSGFLKTPILALFGLKDGKPRMSRRFLAVGLALIVAVVVAACSSSGSSGSSGSSSSTATGTLGQIQKSGTITVGIAVDPPFTLQKPGGQWYSFNPSLLELLGKSLGVKVQFVPTGWATIVAGLQGGKYDIIGASISATAERKKAIDFTTPYAYGGNSWLVLASSKYHSVADLNSPSVTVSMASGSFQQTATQQYMPKAQERAIQNLSYSNLVSELQAGHAQAISVPSFLVQALTQKFGLRAIPDNNQGVEATPVAWGVRKGDTALMNYLDKFIQQQTKNGEIKKLFTQYITVQNSLQS